GCGQHTSRRSPQGGCGAVRMRSNEVSAVLVHGAWADGASWSKIIRPLAAEGVRVSAPPLPLTERMQPRVRSHPVDRTAIVTASADVRDMLREAIAAVRAGSAA